MRAPKLGARIIPSLSNRCVHEGFGMCEFIEFLPGVERIVMPRGEEHFEAQLVVDKLQKVEWIENLADWEVMFTGTYRWQASLDSTRRTFEKFMRLKEPHLSYFYCVEGNPSREGFHVHSLWADARGVFRKDAWAEWFKRYGRARIELVRSRGDVSEYASKYLCKERGKFCWWDVKLQWHWKQRLQGKEFELIGGPRIASRGAECAASSSHRPSTPIALPLAK